MTASRSAPAAMSRGAPARVMPPMAQAERPVRCGSAEKERGAPAWPAAWWATDRRRRRRRSRLRRRSPGGRGRNRRSRKRRSRLAARERPGRRRHRHRRGRGGRRRRQWPGQFDVVIDDKGGGVAGAARGEGAGLRQAFGPGRGLVAVLQPAAPPASTASLAASRSAAAANSGVTA